VLCYASRKRSSLSRPGDDPLRCPLGIALMRRGHVLLERAVPAAKEASGMACHALAFMEALHCRGCQAHIQLLAIKLIRHTVVMALDFQVIID